MCDIDINLIAPWTKEQQKEYLKQLQEDAKRQSIQQEFLKAADIERRLCEKLNVSSADLRKKKPKRDICDKRYIIIKAICLETKLSFAQIAEIFNFDRASVYNALGNVDKFLTSDRNFKNMYVRAGIKGKKYLNKTNKIQDKQN